MSPRVYAAAGLLLLPLGIWWAIDSEGETIAVPAMQGSRSYEQAHREMMYQESFEVGSGVLDVRVYDADVRIKTSAGRQVTVEGWVSARDLGWGRDVFRRTDFRASVQGNTVRVSADDPRISSAEWRGNRGIGIITVVTVPREFDIRVATGDGDVDIEAVRGVVEVRTSDGDIAIQEVIGPTVTLETSDGDVSVGSLEGDDIDIETSDGDINLRSVIGSIQGRTSDGDIVIQLQGTEGDVELRTGDGDIAIYAPRELAADVTLSGAAIEVARSFDFQGSTRRRVVRGTINGGGARVSARTGDGEISLRTR